MELLFIISIVGSAALIMLFFNIAAYKYIVRRALKRFVEPYVENLGFSILSTKFLGLFKIGDFKQTGFKLRPFVPKGNPINADYVYGFLFEESTGNKFRMTAKITTFFMFIKKVEYSEIMAIPVEDIN